jgi:[ribosomal protein S18]-alanine N-acetyltransferase
MKSEEQEQNPVQVRPAGEGDIDALLTIEQQCFNVYYYDYYMLDRRDFEFYLQDADYHFLVATEGTHVVGYILGEIDPWRSPPGAHIDSIAVLPEAQHQGIGALLLQSLTTKVRGLGCTKITLEVSTANEKGLSFFIKHGFRQTRPLPDYYGKGLPGLLMTALLT